MAGPPKPDYPKPDYPKSDNPISDSLISGNPISAAVSAVPAVSAVSAVPATQATPPVPGPPTETAIIVPVPAADIVVAGFRAELDPAARLGVPAHVTVISPFMPPGRVDRDVLATLADTVRSVRAFDATLSRVRWFSDTVVWLAPEPSAPFRELTEKVFARFPDYPPYGGINVDIVPHLTIGLNGDITEMRLAAQVIEPSLPISIRVDRIALIQGSGKPGSWRTVAELPLF